MLQYTNLNQIVTFHTHKFRSHMYITNSRNMDYGTQPPVCLMQHTILMYAVPFHGLVGVEAKPLSSSLFSSPAYFTNSLRRRRVAVTFISSRPEGGRGGEGRGGEDQW